MTETNLYYITVATKPHQVLDKLKEKVKKNNEKIEILGTQENRAIGWEGHQNFGVKLREVSNYLKNPDLNKNDIILFTDAYDVVYCGNLDQIRRRFLTFDKPIIFGAEKQCNPDPHRAREYKHTDNNNDNNNSPEFPYLNSGMFIGRVWALRDCILNYQYNDKDDDQRYWTTCFLENPDLIGLDYKNQLFLNTVDMKTLFFHMDRNNEIAIYKSANPLFIHVNGPNKKELNNYLYLD